MSTTFSVVIRDALESDIEQCLALDRRYETECVWQMTLFEEVGQWQASFKRENLPRKIELEYPVDEHRLRAALPADHCFLVAQDRVSDDVLGYLTMSNQPPHRIALIHDLLVAREYRGHGIGTRLLKVARNWAREHDLWQLMVEVQTKNYPGITFCQAAGFSFCGFNDHYFLNQDIAVFFSQSLR